MDKFSPQVSKNHYFNIKYDSKQRWISYWYQIFEVISKNPNKVLEIGVGNKIVSSYLKKNKINVTTCDFDKSLRPDVVADIRKLPFKNEEFDIILCAEVLEHLPFNEFSKILRELSRVSKKYIILSLPHFSITNFYFGIKLIPFIPKKEIYIKIDFPFSHRYDGEHYWEIGKKNFNLKKIKKIIEKSKLKIVSNYFPYENPKHHFFILEKIK